VENCGVGEIEKLQCYSVSKKYVGYLAMLESQAMDKQTAAKAALTQPISPIPLQRTDFKPSINKHIHSKWQQSWNLQTQNRLSNISNNSFTGHRTSFLESDRKRFFQFRPKPKVYLN